MKTKTINLYTFDELSETAKEKARDWFRGCIDADDFEFVIDDAVRMGALLGIEIASRSWTNSYGYKGSSPLVYWSVSGCQGDGASFEGSYRYAKGAVKAILAETGAGRDDASKGDRELLRIAQDLQKIQKRNFYQLRASISQSGNYTHSHTMSVSVERDSDNYQDMTDDAEDTITELMRDFADWIYSQLDQENDYLMSDESIDDNIKINEYTFTKDGKREG